LVGCGQSQETVTDKPTPPTTNTPIVIDNWSADGVISDKEYSNNVHYGNFELYWSNDDQYIYIGIKVQTLGWLAFGIQPGLKMKDADMIVGFVQERKVYIFDHFSTGDFGPHNEDTELGGTNDIFEYGGSEDEGFTTIEFMRELDTGDGWDIPLTKGPNKIIWAFGTNDGSGFKHTTRGYGEIIL